MEILEALSLGLAGLRREAGLAFRLGLREAVDGRFGKVDCPFFSVLGG